jgi:hypothetical protein
VIGEYAFSPGKRRQNSLGSPAVTCEEVGFNETGQYSQIGFEVLAIDPNRVADCRMTYGDEIGIVIAIMLQTAVVVDQAITQHTPQFAVALSPMSSQTVQESDVLTPHSR